jgi:23S rRNA (pseudouridine1915-N3)-methyltransferase
MRIVLGAVGRLKDGAERTLFDRYWERLEASGRKVGLGPLRLVEIPESRDASIGARQEAEAERLLAATGDPVSRSDAFIISLDERGKALTSAAFADLLRRQSDDGCKSMAFLIGGPDGHGTAISAAARMSLSLSAMTLPHGLARVVLAEQLYRASTILSGHPYHRV